MNRKERTKKLSRIETGVLVCPRMICCNGPEDWEAGMSSNDRQRSLGKLGYGFSAILTLNAAYSLFLFLRSARTIDHIIFGFDVNLLLLITCIGFASMVLYAERENWKPWTALFLSPAIINLSDWLSFSSPSLAIGVRILSIALGSYSFIVFRKMLKRSQ